MPIAPTASNQAEFFQQPDALNSEHTDIHFAARAPPLTSTNVAFTGTAVAEQGNGIIMHGLETAVASLGFGGDLDATNRGALPDRYDLDAEIDRIRSLGDPNAGVVNTDRVRPVNGRVPINSQQYAGTTFELSGELGQKYPHGVPFSGAGYPDFSRYSQANVRIELTGSRSADFAAANRAAGLDRTPAGMTWHHHQDAGYMQLVPTDLHRTVRHTGGVATGRQ